MSLSFLLDVEITGAAETGVKEVALWELIKDASASGFGLVINILLALMLGFSIFVFVERYLALRKATKGEAGFLLKIKDYILMGKIDSAKDYCSRTDSPSARMLEKGISRLGKPIENITATIENTGKLEVLRLEQRLSFLATAAGAAPMIGFLGTTIGMIMVFIDLQNAASLELAIIAPGIMTAMVTTVEGLIVGIVAYVGYNYLVAKVEKVVYQMEYDALEFTDLLHEPGK